ncbi:MAG: succinylglutamate desuccinylase/aspartoacylase family protein [Candidatus Pacearchaeota archaeon]
MERQLRKKLKRRIKNPSIEINYSFIGILTGSDLFRRRIPIMSVKSVNFGPTIWINAGTHGEEVGGIVVVQEIFKRLKRNLLKGRVYAFPLTNPMGFETSSRYITLTEEDLNRAFPGDKEGSLAERMADKIFTTISNTIPDLVLDLHNDWKASIPYILIDPQIGSSQTYDKTKIFAFKTGFPVVLDTENVEKTLTYNLLKNNIPAIAVELGESYVVNEKNVYEGVKAIWNILVFLKMVSPIEKFSIDTLDEKISGKILEYSSKPKSTKSGIIRFLVKPGQIIKKGEPVAKVYNSFGKLLETIITLDEGLVLGYSDYSVAFPGAPIMALGIIK